MPKIFVPAGFDASSVSPELYRFVLETFDKATYVLFEFTSPGPRHRQVDMAVLGPYGVDVVEVKDKVGGAVIASPNGPWSVHYPDGTSETIPLNGASGENPYQQATHTADDLRRWLGSNLDITVKVYPLVLVPRYDPASSMRNSGFVWTANGVRGLRGGLRSQRRYKDPESLTTSDWNRIVSHLELTELPVSGSAANPDSDVLPSTGDPRPVSDELNTDPTEPKEREVVTASHVPAIEVSRDPFRAPTFARKARWKTAGIVAALALVGVLMVTMNALRPSSQSEAGTGSEGAGVALEPDGGTGLPGVAYTATRSTPVSQVASLDGSACPLSHPVKGNVSAAGEKIFHKVGQQYYDVTRPETCFITAAAANAKGFRASLR